MGPAGRLQVHHPPTSTDRPGVEGRCETSEKGVSSALPGSERLTFDGRTHRWKVVNPRSWDGVPGLRRGLLLLLSGARSVGKTFNEDSLGFRTEECADPATAKLVLACAGRAVRDLEQPRLRPRPHQGNTRETGATGILPPTKAGQRHCGPHGAASRVAPPVTRPAARSARVPTRAPEPSVPPPGTPSNHPCPTKKVKSKSPTTPCQGRSDAPPDRTASHSNRSSPCRPPPGRLAPAPDRQDRDVPRLPGARRARSGKSGGVSRDRGRGGPGGAHRHRPLRPIRGSDDEPESRRPGARTAVPARRRTRPSSDPTPPRPEPRLPGRRPGQGAEERGAGPSRGDLAARPDPGLARAGDSHDALGDLRGPHAARAASARAAPSLTRAAAAGAQRTAAPSGRSELPRSPEVPGARLRGSGAASPPAPGCGPVHAGLADTNRGSRRTAPPPPSPGPTAGWGRPGAKAAPDSRDPDPSPPRAPLRPARPPGPPSTPDPRRPPAAAARAPRPTPTPARPRDPGPTPGPRPRPAAPAPREPPRQTAQPRTPTPQQAAGPDPRPNLLPGPTPARRPTPARGRPSPRTGSRRRAGGAAGRRPGKCVTRRRRGDEHFRPALTPRVRPAPPAFPKLRGGRTGGGGGAAGEELPRVLLGVRGCARRGRTRRSGPRPSAPPGVRPAAAARDRPL
ncbi:basic proline-rich protein-like [Mustela nigripes]|uniref:basic proline-rich protein-like n=1 Tax=Mustela nigripes TaxID=77151 RepID=UPI002814A70E|nr:basic proline-rich protein-like [Mustela nigripes]